MRRWRRIFFPLLALTLLSFSAGAGFLVTHPGALNRLGADLHASFYPPPPPVCGDGNCEGKDPYQTRCNTASGPGKNDAAFVANEVGVYDQFGQKLLVVQNWYSPKCQTNWALAYIMYPDELVTLEVFNFVKQRAIYCIPKNCTDRRAYGGIPAQPIYTLMMVTPAPITACALGEAVGSFGNSYYEFPSRSYNASFNYWGYSSITCA